MARLARVSAIAKIEAVEPQTRRDRRLGVPTGDVRPIRGPRRRSDSRLGHDRDESLCDLEPPQGQASPAARSRPAEAAHQAGPSRLRRRVEDRRRRGARAAARRRGIRRPAGSRALGDRGLFQGGRR